MGLRGNRKGFTLIDMMIVLVLIGILAAIVVPIVSGHLDRAQSTSAATTRAMVRKALDLYFQRHGTWPVQVSADLFSPPEEVSMPRGYQLEYTPNSGDLELLNVPFEDLDTAPAVVVVE